MLTTSQDATYIHKQGFKVRLMTWQSISARPQGFDVRLMMRQVMCAWSFDSSNEGSRCMPMTRQEISAGP